MKNIAVVFVVLAFLSLSGCSGMNSTQQKTVSGAGIGAGSGAVLGAVTGGDPVTGAIVGAGVGAAAGYVIGEQDKKR